MDLYQGQVDPTTQVHDYSPGFSPNGLFWVMRLPDDNPLLVDFESAEATLIADLDVLDATKVANSLSLGAAVPAEVTYELRWRGSVKREASVRDETNGFRGLFMENNATIAWSASQTGFKFVSDAASTTTTLFAQLGRESNGIFF
jgi:hypothetical protein